MSQELEGTLTNTADLVGTFGSEGGGGTSNYNDLINKPSINSVTLQGNKTAAQLNLVTPNDLSAVATSGNYNDLNNKPTIPAAQVNSDWNATSGVAEILNKPTLSAVATSGAYSDLTGTPTIPAAQVNSDWNASSGVAEILNKPTLAAVATSGAYSDLTGTPTIPAAQVNSDWNASSGVAEILNKPTIPTKTSELENDSWYVGLWTSVGEFTLTNGQTGNLTLNEDISNAREILIGFFINIGTIGKRIRKTLLIPRYELYYVGMFFDEMATPTERIYFQLDRVDGTHLSISSCSIPTSLSNVGIKIYYR